MSRRFVLDSSAILALLWAEPGSEKVAEYLTKSSISAVNAAEVLTKLRESGITRENATSNFDELGIEIIDFDFKSAAETAELRISTKQLGLSLGDRACLALGIKLDATIVTADKSWAKFRSAKIEVIR